MTTKATHRRLALLGLALAILGSMLLTGPVFANSLDPRLVATYDVDAQLNYGAASLSVSSTARVSNNTGSAVSSLTFNIAPAGMGLLNLGEVKVNGSTARSELTDQTLTVYPPTAIAAGDSANVLINYRASFADRAGNSRWLFSKLNGTIQAYRWIPWLSRATPFNRPNFGDPFVTPSSPEVRVRLNSERKLSYSTSGQRVAGTTLSKTFVAYNVRDFNFLARPSVKVLRDSAAGVNIRVHYSSLNGATMMKWAKSSVATFARLIGPYPYPTLTVAESGGGYAMESPALVWIPRGSSDVPWLVAHEVGHQWFYAVVGNDQPKEPFSDEAIVTLLTREATGRTKTQSCSIKPLDQTIYEYSSCYYGIVYVQGADYLNAYRKRVGETAFWNGLRDYYSTYKFKLGGTRQMLDSLDAASGGSGGGHQNRFPRLY